MRLRRVAVVMAAVLVTCLTSVGVSTPSHAFVPGGGLTSLPSLNTPEWQRYYNANKFAPGTLSNRALRDIILASGDSFDNVCLVATNAGKTGTHVFRGTPSDQTLKCGLAGKELEAPF